MFVVSDEPAQKAAPSGRPAGQVKTPVDELLCPVRMADGNAQP